MVCSCARVTIKGDYIYIYTFKYTHRFYSTYLIFRHYYIHHNDLPFIYTCIQSSLFFFTVASFHLSCLAEKLHPQVDAFRGLVLSTEGSWSLHSTEGNFIFEPEDGWLRDKEPPVAGWWLLDVACVCLPVYPP